VMVAHRHNHRRTQPLASRIEHAAQPTVALCIATVNQVTRNKNGIYTQLAAFDQLEDVQKVLEGIHTMQAVLITRQDVDIRQVKQSAHGSRRHMPYGTPQAGTDRVSSSWLLLQQYDDAVDTAVLRETRGAAWQ